MFLSLAPAYLFLALAVAEAYLFDLSKNLMTSSRDKLEATTSPSWPTRSTRSRRRIGLGCWSGRQRQRNPPAARLVHRAAPDAWPERGVLDRLPPTRESRSSLCPESAWQAAPDPDGEPREGVWVAAITGLLDLTFLAGE